MQDKADAEESGKKMNDDAGVPVGAQEEHQFGGEAKQAEQPIDGKEEIANDITGH